MTNKLDSGVRVCHFVGLSGVGGVQRNFSEYMKLEIISGNEYKHTVYTLGTVDDQYQFSTNILNILELKNLLSLIFDLISKSKIVHFYNNLTSIKVAFFLFFIPVTNLIIHERGSAWNLPSKRGFILKFIAWKSNLIITNSTATKTLVEKKFGISNSKIKVVYNGVNTSIISKKKLLENKETFFIGDKLSDIQAAQSAGATPLLVKTGKGLRTLTNNPTLTINIFNNLYDCAQFIISR